MPEIAENGSETNPVMWGSVKGLMRKQAVVMKPMQFQTLRTKLIFFSSFQFQTPLFTLEQEL